MAANRPRSALADHLLTWYDHAKRDLPWRENPTPYRVWVSEIMLQQTQVATVLPYYLRWMERFPTVESLAAADEQTVLSLWQGLGYYRRGRQLHAAAQKLASQPMPQTATEWQKFPGIGPYTAGAIASIALGEAVPLVDGNVERVFARLNAFPASGPALHRAAWDWATAQMVTDRPGDWNQALMELGATVCRPRDPDCPNCPVQEFCEALARGKATDFPVPGPKKATVGLVHEVYVPVCGGKWGVRQIPHGQWWQSMWEFYRVDQTADSVAEATETLDAQTFEIAGQFRHAVTHHRIAVTVYRVECRVPHPDLRWVDRETLSALPMPAAQRKALALCDKLA
jgi:A/G-specific adenine glycosylase